MKKYIFCAACILSAGLLAGCASKPSSPAAATARAQQPIFQEFQKRAAKILDSGGLAAVGIGESKSLEIALNKAKASGRSELAQIIDSKIESLQKDFLEETGPADQAQILQQFSRTAQLITSQQLRGSVAQDLQYDVANGTVTACALMVLNPKQIVHQIEKNEALYTRFRASKAFEELSREIKEYEAYKTGERVPTE